MKLSFKQLIWAIPCVAALLFAAGIAVMMGRTSTALHHIDLARTASYPALEAHKVLMGEVRGIAEDMQQAVTEGDQSVLTTLDERQRRFAATLATLGRLPGQQAVSARVQTEFDAYYRATQAAGRLLLGVEAGEPQAHIADMQGRLKSLNAELARDYEAESRILTSTLLRISENVTSLMTLAILVALAVAVGLTLASHLIIRLVWDQLGGEPGHAIALARTIAAGDFRSIIATLPGDRSSLLVTLRAMQDKLAGTIARIQDVGNTIANAAHAISEGNADLATRTVSQERSLEQTAASVRQLSNTVRQNAASAEQANRLVESAASVAVKGGQAVAEVAATMSMIRNSSHQVADIIGVIDSIAFQTNILALNAAVEAARAGVQGRGFAVVAAEVRNLAQRATGAAQEIKILISDNVQRIADGAQLTDHAGTTMNEIVASVSHVTAIMAEITAASREQTAGIAQITHALGDMEDVTLQNAALVEQAAAAAGALRDQTTQLAQAVSIFTLGSGRTTGSVRRLTGQG